MPEDNAQVKSGETAPPKAGEKPPDEGEKKTYTAEEFNYLKRQHDKLAKDMEGFRKAEEDRKKSEMTELDRLKAEIKEREAKLAEVESKRKKTIVHTEAKLTAQKLGFNDPEDAIKLISLDLDVDDNDSFDRKALESSLQALLKAKPYLAGKGRPANIGGAMNPPQKNAEEGDVALAAHLFGAGR